MGPEYSNHLDPASSYLIQSPSDSQVSTPILDIHSNYSTYEYHLSFIHRFDLEHFVKMTKHVTSRWCVIQYIPKNIHSATWLNQINCKSPFTHRTYVTTRIVSNDNRFILTPYTQPKPVYRMIKGRDTLHTLLITKAYTDFCHNHWCVL